MQLKEYLITIISYLRHKGKRKLLRLCFLLKNKKGVEIGGPSYFFQLKGYFPIYASANQVDVVNYSSETVWEGSISQGYTYKYYKNKKGYQYIDEASELNNVQDKSYDFVLSSHSLEHIANPIKALSEWKRVLKFGGFLVLVLPKKESTFDHNRNYTTLEHLIDDYKNDVEEDDSTHFDEVLSLHDISRDPGISLPAELRTRTLENYKNRCVHHHVFSLPLVKHLLEYCGFDVLHQQQVYNFHLVSVAQVKKN